MPNPINRLPFPMPDAIPREHWDHYPWNRWTFQNVRQMVATAEVWRGSGAVWELPEHPTNLDELLFDDAEGATRSIREWMQLDCNDGFVVLHNGAVVYERYNNEMTQRSLHLSQSMAKSVTASVAGILIGRGLLEPEKPVTDYLPELDATAYKGATLRDVLDMASGVHYTEDYEDLNSHIAALDIACGWKLPREGADSPDCMWDHILSLTELAEPHGTRFNYRSIETDIIAHCMERVTSKRLPVLVSEEIWQPLGCEESADFSVDRTGYALASGGLSASLRDYARFGQMLCNGGVGNGKRIVPFEWISDTTRSDAREIDEYRKKAMPNGGYRNQFWLRDRDRRILMARGIFGQLIYVDRDLDLVAVVLSSWPESVNVDRNINSFKAIDAIAEALSLHGE
ncbi:MAG: serine hydrolase [Pseudomonadota bacterium]